MTEEFILSVDVDDGQSAQKLGDVSAKVNDLKQQQKELSDQQKTLQKAIADTTKAQSNLDKQYSEGTISQTEYNSATKLLTDSQQQLMAQSNTLSITQKEVGNALKVATTEQNNLLSATQLSTKTNKDYDSSLASQELKLKDMQKAYASLSAEQRNTTAGKAFQKSIEEQAQSVAKLKTGIGQTAGGFGQMTDAIGKQVPMVGSLNNALKSLASHPIILIITVVVGLISQIIAAMQKNEECVNSLNKALSPLKAVMTLINQAFEALVSIITDKVIAVIDTVTQKIEWLTGKLSVFLKNIGMESAAKFIDETTAKIKAQTKEESDLIAREQALAKAKRDTVVAEAQLNKEAAKQREIADDASKSYNERIAALEKYNAAQRKIAENNAKIAKEEYEIAKARAAQGANSAEDNDKLAQLQAKAIAAEDTYTAAVRKSTKELQSLRAQQASEEAKNAEERLKILKEYGIVAEQTEEDTLNGRINAFRKKANEFALSEEEIQKGIINITNKYNEEQLRISEEAAAKRAEFLAKYGSLFPKENNAIEQLRANLDSYKATLDEALAQDLISEAEFNQMYESARIDTERRIVDEVQAIKDKAAEDFKSADLQKLEEEYAERSSYLWEQYENELLTYEEFITAKREMDEDYADYKAELENQMIQKNLNGYLTAQKNMFQSAQNLSQGLDQLMQTTSKNAQSNSKATKALAMATIVATEAQAIANGAMATSAAAAGAAEAAASGGPAAPFLLATYIATMVGSIISIMASVTSSISKAKSTLSGDAGNFATGGFVGGNSYSGDKVIAHVNSGESILTPTQQRNFMNLANSGGTGIDYDRMATAFANAIEAMPAPVMVYSQFEDFQNNVQINKSNFQY